MARFHKQAKHLRAKTVLRLPDLEQSKRAVLNSLAAASSQESYEHAIHEFIGWYCSEPRLSFNRTVVLRYRFFLEQEESRSFHDQCTIGSSPVFGLRSRRYWSIEPGVGRRHPACQRRQTLRRQSRELADNRAIQSALTEIAVGDSTWQTGSRHPVATDRMRAQTR
jgi:hypothetical protein